MYGGSYIETSWTSQKPLNLLILLLIWLETQSKQHNGHTVLPGQKANHIPTYQMAAVIVEQRAHCWLTYVPTRNITYLP